ncbi:phosphate ABC transporter ATP-binding protein [Fodinisporobacter ferrooxydans]|uniref:Phosphate ABC transporter ATP-binding protein n=1 Tax=Fodinisporobacter ferrooxydans TaxID=2901836 RepID=A0ABY4CNN2_9BACL|nr:phosphate ABC transporter ATP-binding protein [Alicyclobacillaceae bacterium MYW30-H2]
MEEVIRFSKVAKYIQTPIGRQAILNEVSGSVPKGVILTLIGPSGAGKSTLLSLCNLLATPDEGHVYVDGKEVRSWPITELRRSVGYVMQTPTMLPGTVMNNLAIAAQLHGKTLENPGHFLDMVGLDEELLSKSAQDLSGGQKQRVALARTLVNHPSILLLDEVTSALDPGSTREIEDLLLGLQKNTSTTILWITHDLQQARRVGDYTWLLANGQVIEADETERFFSKPKEQLSQQFLTGV